MTFFPIVWFASSSFLFKCFLLCKSPFTSTSHFSMLSLIISLLCHLISQGNCLLLYKLEEKVTLSSKYFLCLGFIDPDGLVQDHVSATLWFFRNCFFLCLSQGENLLFIIFRSSVTHQSFLFKESEMGCLNLQIKLYSFQHTR